MTKILRLPKSFILWFILKDKGSISKKNADSFAHAEYDEFNKVRKFISDFDESVKQDSLN